METNKARTLQEEIEIVDGCDAAVDNGAWLGVTVFVCILGVRRIEASVMAFSANDDGELGTIRLRCVKLPERLVDLWHLLSDDGFELSLGDLSEREPENGIITLTSDTPSR